MYSSEDSKSIDQLTVAIAFSQYHVSSFLVVVGVLAIVWGEIKIKERQDSLLLQNMILTGFLIITAITFMAMAIPFTCLCDAWKIW